MVKKDNSDEGNLRMEFIFLYQNCNFNDSRLHSVESEKSKDEKIKEEQRRIIMDKEMTRSEVFVAYDSNNCLHMSETYKNYVYNSKKVSIFLISKYILEFSEQMHDLVSDCNLFDNTSVLDKFSMTSQKLQKLIIIAVLDYFHVAVTVINCEDISQVANEFNPINEFDSVINEKCGYSIDYRFSQFGLPTIYNYTENMYNDYNKSLTEFLINKDDEQKLFEWLKSFEKHLSLLDQMVYSIIPDKFKDSIVNILIKYILYTPYELGRLLDRTKSAQAKIGDKISLSTVFENLEQISTEGFLFL